MASRSIYPVSPQNFPFHAPMMSHIYANRSHILHTKLNESCKYSFVKNHIIVVDEVYFSGREEDPSVAIDFSDLSPPRIELHWKEVLPSPR